MKYLKSALSIVMCAVIASLCACSQQAEEETTAAETVSATGLQTVTVVIPEGTSCSEIAVLLEENEVCSAEDFIAECSSSENLSLLPSYVTIDNPEERTFLLEGYLFPDTYEFYKNCSAHTALLKFLDNTNSKLTPEYAAKAEEMGFTLDEIITVASLVQEESGVSSEMNKVASVIYNRLESSDYPYIQCDVTIKYLENYVKPYFTSDEYSELCYNYNIVSKRKGLPAGAITNPGIEAIEAALDPADSDWYYFVTDSDGNYYYAETYEQHVSNCHTAGIEGY